MHRVFLLCIIIIIVILTGCETAPKNIENACYILNQKNRLFFNWKRSLKSAEKKYKVPISIIMATIYVESGFKQNARPIKKIVSFISWKYLSSAYGYSQAVNKTWEEYRKKTGRLNARRSSFSDSVDFIAWYHNKSMKKYNISPYNAYNLYLNYYMGHFAYKSGKISKIAIQGAKKMQIIARKYQQQLINCKIL